MVSLWPTSSCPTCSTSLHRFEGPWNKRLLDPMVQVCCLTRGSRGHEEPAHAGHATGRLCLRSVLHAEDGCKGMGNRCSPENDAETCSRGIILHKYHDLDGAQPQIDTGNFSVKAAFDHSA